MILFLDFDGVLHPDPCELPLRLFENVARLSEALAEYAEVCVVLSTSWRSHYDIKQLTTQFPAALRERVIGVTPVYGSFKTEPRLSPYRRQAECMAWLNGSGQTDRAWVALDDREYWFEPYCENLVLCNSQIGFDAAAQARLRTHLSRARDKMLRAIDSLL